MGRSTYRLDKRHYKGVFRPGFFAHLDETRFWQADNDPYQRAKRRRRKIIAVIALLVMAGLVWVAIESSRALSLF